MRLLFYIYFFYRLQNGYFVMTFGLKPQNIMRVVYVIGKRIAGAAFVRICSFVKRAAQGFILFFFNWRIIMSNLLSFYVEILSPFVVFLLHMYFV